MSETLYRDALDCLPDSWTGHNMMSPGTACVNCGTADRRVVPVEIDYEAAAKVLSDLIMDADEFIDYARAESKRIVDAALGVSDE